MASVLSITAGFSGGMVEGPGGAGLGLPTSGGASAAAMQARASAIVKARRSVGTSSSPMRIDSYHIRVGGFMPERIDATANLFDG